MSIVLWAQEAVFTHVIVVRDRICKFCIWVELPVQRRLPDFLKVASGNPTFTCIPRVDG